MSRYHSYLNTSKEILQQNKGDETFALFLKSFFSQNKKYGSKDRKQISHLCYCFFRMGKAVMNISLEEKILVALFLCTDQPNETLKALKPEWNEKIHLATDEKLFILKNSILIENIFPWKDELSSGIDYEKFCASFFSQPDLFLRIRPGHAEAVLLKLDKIAVAYEFIAPFTIRLPNSFKADQYFELDKEVVVQDYSSQCVADFLPVRPPPLRESDQVWDCCAGSGGKSILAYDINPSITLTVSDMRESILANLEKRFLNAGIKKYKQYVFDILKGNTQHSIFNNKYSTIIADVPCTGSGTWGRSPDQLYYFDEARIESYSALQKRIVSKAIPQLQPEGYFVYITCSVFKKENLEVVEYIKENFQLNLIKMEILKGYTKKADTMFAALLQKTL